MIEFENELRTKDLWLFLKYINKCMHSMTSSPSVGGLSTRVFDMRTATGRELKISHARAVVKIAHFRLLSACQKLACLSSREHFQQCPYFHKRFPNFTHSTTEKNTDNESPILNSIIPTSWSILYSDPKVAVKSSR